MKYNQKTKIFVAGSDTNVGKTYIANNLLKCIISHGYTVTPFKPVETGCKKINKKLIPNDAQKFFLSINKAIDLDEINPYRFVDPISPTKAMILAKKRVFLRNYLKKIDKLQKSDFLLIEGAGGMFSPIARDGLNIDLVEKIQGSVLLVVEDKVGAINQTLLNLESFKKRKVKLIGIVLNRKLKVVPKGMNNLKEIKRYTKIPIFQTYNSNVKSNSSVFVKLFNLMLS